MRTHDVSPGAPLVRVEEDGIYDHFFMLLLTPVAVGTILTWLAQVLHLEFATYSYLIVASSALCVLVFLVPWLRAAADAARKGRPASALLLPLGLALVGAVPALLYNRPHADDYFYLANVVHYLGHPTEAMGFDVKFIATLSAPLQSFIWSTSGPYEYIQGSFAHVFSVSVLDIYYFVATTLAGALIAMSLLFLTRLLVPTDTAAIAGTALALIVILSLFEHARTPGSVYFVQTFEGKFVYLTALQPIFAAFSLKFLDSGRGRDLLYLLVTVVAGIGMTASAAVLLPMFAAVLAASFLLASLRQKRFAPSEGLSRTARYGICLAPCLAYLIIYQTYFSAGLGSGSLANEGGAGTTVAAHLHFLLFIDLAQQPPGISYTAIAFVLFSAAALCLTKGFTRDLIALWLVCAFLFFLDPVTGDLLMRLLHLENIFWRVFFILPFPLVAAIVGALLYERIGMSSSLRTAAAAGCAALFLLASVLIPYLRGELIFPPAHKLPSAHNAELQDVIRVADHLRSGVTLAPFEVSGLLAIHRPDLQFVSMRNELVWLNNINMRDDGERRIKAALFLETAGQPSSAEFMHIVDQYRPANIIASRKSRESNRAVFNLLSRDYFEVAASTGYVFYGRRNADANRPFPPQARLEPVYSR